ncbi:UPF0179 family protein [Haloferax mediterranei ATCC 33500]|uniref:UPF0179 protein HFX_2840 n=1 Tax=Haloferax mediterranei (strain ATCC 33500 / DSM 1411 / JCM 8866 / NBRC 14739 / NCIMB 2177 / R-4) TaxID=523841 RepID=I3R8F1_HALMT|nr:UPF0179 family protein [Haloferax mediterranei]AFK20511.1 hypothetical protein HFX_2840 [Haloferax mediterranei ATCC 33500]AHZ23870.1 hypothetical protein BM92_15000 [Haloferax mediterranei ATCC 33500]ELZ98294.1 hypothetical protein C439_15955 [Haloferax mediterranei ATCC 33500]MDX5986733.1 UPF0179 family protein [Haloferax mediterranei ATCC 33500]QCQ76057.1 UPF0179 family protein [Haloferax mediterranei ATCC 33500]
MTSITLIGARLADPGTEFVYRGESSACEGCPYRQQCLNLTEGVRYRVIDVRENTQVLDCAVHDEGVRAVEVEPAPVRANVPSKGAYAGSKASLQGPCPHTECPSHQYCVPEGAEFDQEYRISTVIGDPPHDHCYLDRNLTLVEFEAADE